MMILCHQASLFRADRRTRVESPAALLTSSGVGDALPNMARFVA